LEFIIVSCKGEERRGEERRSSYVVVLLRMLNLSERRSGREEG
jgi:hypothetical protein